MIFVLKRKWDAEAVRMYQEGLENQLQEAKKAVVIAKAEGERKKALETALEFKKMGLPIADIAKGTGLSIDEIEKLK
ncbi:hypothetical protein ABE426_01155 [Sphingobacterium faecium]|uniref:hypothetical protein n=1 Tax=Sphingobacterium faecium TaxID=34087 RepID=UPI00320AAEDC